MASLIFDTTVGRKILMGITGLFLCVFLITHLSGNLLLFQEDGGKAFNEYTVFMTSNLFIRIVEVVLVIGFAMHIWLAVRLTRKNYASRTVKYAVSKVDQTANIFSRNMGVTGSIILIFLILHLRTFWFTYKFGDIPMATYEDGTILKDMFFVVKAAFSEGWYSALYVVAMILLGGHLIHGFQSAFRSLGINNKGYAPILTNISIGFAIAITVGFSLMPILFYFGIAK
jgi:succinate dehydrogenase / fumarate reductase, cytochrome b subunit